MYNIYGIVKVEYYSYNKDKYFVYISNIISLLWRNLKTSIVYCGALNIDSNQVYMWHYISRQT